ncbi:MAG: two-component regulator propeller domain-containing protein [Acidobacteriota bacterium]|nr:two-component regulator propeller domain-containing protein [Acidobacteriota bacterium]
MVHTSLNLLIIKFLFKKGLLLAWLISSLSWTGSAGEMRFKRKTVNDGLSEGHVFCILQDSRGFMWFGTRDGLNRFDGYRFKAHRRRADDPFSISNNYIYALAEDSKGNLWIGTRGGLNRYDHVTERFEAHEKPVNQAANLSTHTVWDIVEDPTRTGEQVLWLATEETGLVRYTPQTGQAQIFIHNESDPNSLPIDEIWSLVLIDNRLWLGTFGGGLAVMPLAAPGQFTTFRNDPDREDSLLSDSICTLFQDRRGKLWIGTRYGLSQTIPEDPTRFRNYRLEHKDSNVLGTWVLALEEDHTGSLWVATHGGGLHRYLPETDTFERYRGNSSDPVALPDDKIRSLYTDRTGVLWVGTYGNGVAFNTPADRLFRHWKHVQDRPRSLSHNMVNSILKDESGVLWIGTDDGLNRLEGNMVQVFQHRPQQKGSLPGEVVTALTMDRKGTLWVGTNGAGLSRFNAPESRFEQVDMKYPDNRTSWVRSLFTDASGKVYITSYGNGLTIVDPADSSANNYPPKPDQPDAISHVDVLTVHGLQDPAEPLWIGSFGGGLHRMERDKPGVFRQYKKRKDGLPGLSDNGILALQQDSQHRLWIGTPAGLDCLDLQSGVISSWTEDQGLKHQLINGILIDSEDMVWLSTNRGLTRFDPRTQSFRHLELTDGLPVNSFNIGACFAGKDSMLYFGSSRGLVAFDPTALQPDRFAPQPALTGFLLDNKLMPPEYMADKVLLDYRNRMIEVQFSALHYGASDRNRYRYRLLGFDDRWVETGADNRRATYTNLDPGSYTFELMGSNKDGVWSEQPATLSLVMPAPPWFRWYAKCFYALVALSVIALIVRAQRAKLLNERRLNEKLEDLVRERTRELVLAQKNMVEEAHLAGMAEIAAEVIHQMGNRLNSFITSVRVLRLEAEQSRGLAILERLQQLAAEQGDDLGSWVHSEQGKQLPTILARVQTAWQRQLERLNKEIGTLDHHAMDFQNIMMEQLPHAEVAPEPRSVDLDAFLADYWEREKPYLQEENIRVTFQPAAPVPVSLVERRFHRILACLIQNAVEAAKGKNAEARVHIDVTTREIDGGVVLTMEDNGGGIHPKLKSHVFNSGFSTKPGRRGLGLHYVGNAMNGMGGRIELENRDNGLAVHLTFPKSTEQLQADL